MTIRNYNGSRFPKEPGPRVFSTNASALRSSPIGDGVGVGIQYGGNRNIYNAAGYKTTVSFADVKQADDREHVASRILSIFPDYTWRKRPILVDGLDEEGPRDTEFCEAWKMVFRSGRVTSEGETKIGLDWALPQLDRMSLMGRHAVLYLGFIGDKSPEEPVEMGEFSGAGVDGLAYTAIYGETSATVSAWETDPRSPRYGRPKFYSLKGKRGSTSIEIGSVHWTRVIHLAQNGLADLVTGRPLLGPVFNLLQDILKVSAGTGEAGYRNADPGMVITTQPAFESPEAGDALDAFLGGVETQEDKAWLEAMEESIQAYINGLERFMILEGYDVKLLDGSIADPRGPVETYIDLISGALGIPQRLLLGNEAGDLASSQDQANWSSVIETRQRNVAEPTILRPVVNRLVWAGVLPPPREEDFTVIWPSLYSVPPEVQVDIAAKAADTLNKIGAVVDPAVFVATYLPDLPPEAIVEAGILPPESEGAFNAFRYP